MLRTVRTVTAASATVLVLSNSPGPASLAFAAGPEPRGVAPTATNEDEQRPMPVVTWVGEQLSVSAERSDLRELLRLIESISKVPIVVDPAVEATVTVAFRDLPLRDGIRKVLRSAGEGNFVVEFHRPDGVKGNEMLTAQVRVVQKAPAPSPAEIAAAGAAREKELREYFEAMDKGRGKIARALRRYQDPDLSPAERSKLRTYLRQTSVDDPEDKQMLKMALLDESLKGAVVSDVQMALMHAMQDHPEESDKDFILELLKKRNNRVGWLYYSMLKVWDARYVPYLIAEIIEEPRSRSAIEILYRMQIKEAVPFLIVALEDKDYAVRREAAFALKALTGKDYPFKPYK